MILSYLSEPKKFWVEDVGSIFGTYIRVKGSASLMKGQTYIVGADVSFNIVDVWNEDAKD